VFSALVSLLVAWVAGCVACYWSPEGSFDRAGWPG